MRVAVIAYAQVTGPAAAPPPTAAAGNGFPPAPPGAPTGTPGTIDLRATLPLAKLEQHLDWYKANGLEAIALDDLIEGRLVPSGGARRIAITFDGGFETHYRLVFPALQDRRMRATFFVPADMMDRPGGLARSEIEIMAAGGMGLGVLVPPATEILRMLPAALGPALSEPRRTLEAMAGRPVFIAATSARHVEAPLLRTLRAHDYRAAAISEVGNHVVRDGMVVIARYFHRKSLNSDEWKAVARLAPSGPARSFFNVRTQ